MKFMITIVKTSRFRIIQARDSDATATAVLYRVIHQESLSYFQFNDKFVKILIFKIFR